VTADNRDIGLEARPEYLEGPWVERFGNRYVLFDAAIYKDKGFPDFLGYHTGAAVADNPLGPWTKDRRGIVFRGGHLAVFRGPDDRPWFSFRIEHDDRSRGRLAVEPFEVAEDGTVRAEVPGLGLRSVPLPAR
jgi:hypothetical protein